MPKPKRPHVASPDEIKFTRNGDEVIVQYADPKVATTHLKMGRDKLDRMTDEDLLAYWNEHVEALDEHMRNCEYVAVEVPLGKPQVRYFEEGDQWAVPTKEDQLGLPDAHQPPVSAPDRLDDVCRNNYYHREAA